MIKKILYVSLVIIIAFVSIYQLITIMSLSRTNKILSESYNRSINDISLLKEMLTNSILLENNSLSDSTIFNEENIQVDKKLLLCTKPTLVFRYSNLNCASCILKNINTINMMVEKRKIRIIIISDYHSKRELGLFKRLNNIENEIFNCNLLSNNENHTPYFCIINEKGKLNNVFFPDDNFDSLTEKYLDIMTQKYFLSIKN